jgi:hypothetical protein
MPANDNVTVRIVGDASQVQPAVEQTTASLGNLEPMLAELNSSIAALTTQMREGFASGATGAKQLAVGMEEAKVASVGLGAGIEGAVLKIHEGAEAVRTFQMRAKEFAELYVALFAVEAIKSWAESLGEAAEKTEQLGAKLGMSVTDVQGLGAAAQMSGIDMDTLSKALGMMDNKALQSTASTSSVTKSFRAMGVGANDGATNMQRLLTIADRFHDMADGPTKAALAMQLFGRSGREMIPFLNQGADAIQQLMDKSKEYGVENEAAVEQGERLATSVNESKVAWEGLKETLTQAFGPLLTEGIDGFNALVKTMHDSYESGGAVKIIFDTIVEVLQGLGEMIGAVVLAFEEFFGNTAAAGVSWGTVIKTVIDAIVVAFKTVVAMAVFVADAFIAAFDLMKAGAEEFLAGFTDSTGSIRIIGTGLGVFMQAVGKVCWDALHLDWASITADWTAGMEQVRQAVAAKAQEVLAETHKMSTQAQADFQAAMGTGKSFGNFFDQLMKPGSAPKHDNFKFSFGGGGGEAPDVSAPGALGSKGKKPKDDLVQQLDAELEEKKTTWAQEQLAQDTAQEYSLQSELDFWQQALQRADLSAKDKLAIEKKYVAAAQAVQKEEIAKKLDGYKADIAAAGNNSQAKLQILEREAAYVHRIYGDQSKEAAAADAEIVKAAQQAAEQLRQLWDSYYKEREKLALIGVDNEQVQAEFEVELGTKTKSQLLAQEKRFEDQRYAIQLDELNREKALIDPNRDPAAFQKINQQIEQLYAQHQQKLTTLDRQAVLQRTQIERQGVNSLAASWAGTISKMITLQEGWRAGLVGIYEGLVQTVAQVLEQIIEKWIAAFLIKLLLGKQEAAQNATNYVAEAGAGGVASMAAAPFPINLTAPAFGASMAAAAAAFGAVTAAEGGDWNVREGMYHLHEKEMVLPEWAASPLRDMLGGAGSGAPATGGSHSSPASAGGDVHLHYSPSIHERERVGLKQLLASGGSAMIDFLEQSARDGKLSGFKKKMAA